MKQMHQISLLGIARILYIYLLFPIKKSFDIFFNFFRMVTLPLLILSPPSTDSKSYYHFWVSIIIENQSSDYHLLEFD